ncbi:hypothetical protein [Actinoplanes sp. URMC 104]|uniref:hypothetical protein n=1 Tax=Actinoplanes sp. URMC 104 TaxID=3423409 RepID=UPI003F1A9CAA
MSAVPELANTVNVGGRAYLAGTRPPLAVAKQIKSRSAWGGQVPDLSGAKDGDETAGPAEPSNPTGVIGGDAAIPLSPATTLPPATAEDQGDTKADEAAAEKPKTTRPRKTATTKAAE